jgi:hypothetical protein
MRKIGPSTTASIFRACWGFRANLIADEADLRYASCNFLYYKALESRLLAIVREVRSNEINLVARRCKNDCATIKLRVLSANNRPTCAQHCLFSLLIPFYISFTALALFQNKTSIFLRKHHVRTEQSAYCCELKP